MSQKIAIVGGGIAGLTAAYLLNRKYDITLFEKDGRIGGNAYTYQTKNGEKIDIAVAAYSKLVSGEFLKLCRELNIKMIRRPTHAMLSIHNVQENNGVYLTPFNLKGLLTQRFAIFKPEFVMHLHKTIISMLRAKRLLWAGRLEGKTFSEALEMLPELTGVRKDLIMAPLCLLSSMYYEEVLNSPAEYFVQKSMAFREFQPVPQLMGLFFPKDFTSSYVNAISSPYSDRIRLNSNIKSVSRQNGSVKIKFAEGEEQSFDKVVFACNADQALALLENPTPEEKRLLGAWRYKDGLMVVHKDDTHFPKRELCQSWTCLYSKNGGAPSFSITICGWRLCHGTPKTSKYLCTQHPNFPIKEELIEFKKVFRTPIYDFKSYAASKEMPGLNGKENTYYCGSHFGLGLHNDAVTSAIDVGRQLGVEWGSA